MSGGPGRHRREALTGNEPTATPSAFCPLLISFLLLLLCDGARACSLLRDIPCSTRGGDGVRHPWLHLPQSLSCRRITCPLLDGRSRPSRPGISLLRGASRRPLSARRPTSARRDAPDNVMLYELTSEAPDALAAAAANMSCRPLSARRGSVGDAARRQPTGDDLKTMLKGIGGSQLQILKPDSASRAPAPLTMASRSHSFSSGKLAVAPAATGPFRGETQVASPMRPVRSMSSASVSSNATTAAGADDEAMMLAVELNAKAK